MSDASDIYPINGTQQYFIVLNIRQTIYTENDFNLYQEY